MCFSAGIIHRSVNLSGVPASAICRKVGTTDIALSRRCGGTFQYCLRVPPPTTGVLALAGTVEFISRFTNFIQPLIVTERSLLEIVFVQAESPPTPEDAEVNKTVAGKNVPSGVPVAVLHLW